MGYVSLIALGLALASLAYLLLALFATQRFGRRPAPPAGPTPPVTILKPVCGLDWELYENLRSFCLQDYPEYQVIFGVADRNDPAVAVVERLIREFPDLDLSLVIEARTVGSNRKVCNLINMYPQARHDLLNIADSDMRVSADYLVAVMGAFADPAVGAVTCLYTGTPRGGIASRLGAAFINEWFGPSVLVALTFQKLNFCFGATMAVRRDVLERIGGFNRLAQSLADDYLLGNLVSALGYKVALAPYLVENIVHEPGLSALFHHELRWARTVRTVQPIGYSLSFVTYALPVALLVFALWPSVWVAGAVVAAATGLRVLLHFVVRRRLALKGPARPWLVPFRDCAGFAVWAASFLGREVSWREQRFFVHSDGNLSSKEV